MHHPNAVQCLSKKPPLPIRDLQIVRDTRGKNPWAKLYQHGAWKYKIYNVLLADTKLNASKIMRRIATVARTTLQ